VSAGGQTCPSRLRFRKCGNVVKTGINHFMFDGIYHPFIYIYIVFWGMVIVLTTLMCTCI
jgi:hypothetical protein